MITLEFSGRPSEDKRLQAGYSAEETLAHYLNRAFGEEAYIHIFHGLRVERNGEAAQIDHLVLHRFGFVLVESKSISEKIEINEYGEFARSYKGQLVGIPSPIAQAKRQADLLAKLLDDHKAELRKKIGIGLLKKQAHFSEQRFQVFAAVSDKGRIECATARPTEVMKADAIVDAIQKKIAYQKSLAGFGGIMGSVLAEFTDKKKAREHDKDYLQPFTDDEFEAISTFLLASNKPGRQSTNLQPATANRPTATPAAPKAARPSARQTSTVPKMESTPELGKARKSPPANNMKRWSEDELARLRQAFEAGKRPEDIATAFGRTPYALRKRAETIGLIEDVSKW